MLGKTIRKMMFNRPFYDKLEFTNFVFAQSCRKCRKLNPSFLIVFFMGFLCAVFIQVGISAF